MRVTLKNNFHDTECQVNMPGMIANPGGPTEDMHEAWRAIQDEKYNGNPRRYNRVWRELCGSRDCMCGIVRN